LRALDLAHPACAGFVCPVFSTTPLAISSTPSGRGSAFQASIDSTVRGVMMHPAPSRRSEQRP
jgi:hypothetical protein